MLALPLNSCHIHPGAAELLSLNLSPHAAGKLTGSGQRLVCNVLRVNGRYLQARVAGEDHNFEVMSRVLRHTIGEPASSHQWSGSQILDIPMCAEARNLLS
jgi:hypothetical protein